MNARTKIRPSADVTKDIEALGMERHSAETRIDELDRTWEAVLLSGDDDRAERHQSEKARLGRSIERAGLRLAALAEELEGSQAHEQAQETARIQAATTAAVDAAISDEAIAKYEKAARQIVAFLETWRAATEQAKAAKVDSPSDRLRTRPGRYDPPHDELYSTYVDEQGNETSSQYPHAIQYDHEDSDGNRFFGTDRYGKRIRIEPLQKVTRSRRVPGKSHPDVHAPDLLEAVRLPGIRLDDDPIWPQGGA